MVRRFQVGPPGSPDEDGDRFIEIWNLVFMQFEQIAPGNRNPLPKPSIDTGMGLERITAVLQGKHDNYDVDLLRVIMEASANLTNSDPDGPQRASHKVIADHVRACFLPDRRRCFYRRTRDAAMSFAGFMRRAMRHAHMLGATDPVVFKMVPALTGNMGQHYPELLRAEPLITETLKLEEERFKATLGRGLRLLEEETDKLGGRRAFGWPHGLYTL